MRLTRRRLILLALVIALVFAIPVANGYMRAASLVVRAAGMHGQWVDRLAAWQTRPFTTRDTSIPARGGTMRARVYQPEVTRARTVLLTGGVHAKGIDEPRLMKLAGDLAAGGTPVITAEVPDLLRYRITPALTDAIEDAAVWVSSQPAFAPDGRIGIFGVSFAGGLSISAAGRPRVRDHVAYVLSFGGHGDLVRTVRFLCSGLQADGQMRKPHDYGVVVTLINAADRVVPPEQVEPLRAAIVSFLTASHLDMVDKTAAKLEFEHARALQQTLPEPAATLMDYVNTRNVKALGERLLPHLDAFANDPALSPEIAPALTAPVFLIHGADDNVVPAVESTLLARALESRVPVHLLVTPLITHAEVDRQASAGDVWHLMRFWYAVGQAGKM
jgi:dienelactone hydrolase